MKPARWSLISASFFGAFALTSPASAASCPPTGRAWITLSLDGQSPSEGDSDVARLYRRVSMLLQAELDRRSLLVCPDDTQPGETGPSARVHLQLDPAGAVAPASVDIQVDDAVTGKNVNRRVELARVPADSRALVIAVGADELLSASWAELSLKQAPLPAVKVVPAPPPVTAPPTPQQRRRIDLELVGFGEIDAAKHPRFGAELRNAWWPTRAFAISLELGFAHQLAFAAPDGTVHTDSFLLGAGFAVPVVKSANAGVELGAAVRLGRTLVRGAASDGATATSGAFSSAGAEAQLHSWWAPGFQARLPLWALVSHLGVGGFFADADALDGQNHLKLQKSPFVNLGLGLAVQIP